MAVEWVVFHVTDRCQLNCKHCLRDPEKSAHDIDLALVARVLDEAVQIYGCHHAGLTGGEPTLHPEFLGIVDAIITRGLTWHVVTNGLRFDQRLLAPILERPRRREALTAIDFSLDGASEAVHDRIRGAGSFRALLSAISAAHAHGLPFALQSTLNRYNLEELEALAMMGAQLGAARVSFGMTQATGTYLDREMFLSRAELEAAAARIDRLSGVLRIPVSRSEGFRNPRPFHLCEPFKSDILHVDYRGLLNLCCQHAGVPGSNGTSDALADLEETRLVEGHRRMLAVIQQFQEEKLAALEAGRLEAWDYFPCNYCMKYFGKPHWTDQGPAGAVAERARWRGAWSPERHVGTAVPTTRRLRVLADGA